MQQSLSWEAGIAQWYSAGLRAGAGNFSLHHEFRLALGPTQPPIRSVPWALPWGYSGWGVKLTTHLHLVPKSRKSGSIYLHFPNTPPWRGAQLKKAQGQI